MRQLLRRTERIIANAGNSWAVADDGVQWILLRCRSKDHGGWLPVSYVRSSKDVLARCMREKGTDDDTAVYLLQGLWGTYDEWKALRSAPESPP